MKKLLCVLLLVLPVLVFADVGIGSAQEPADFEFILPSIVAVLLSDASITWDFTDITVNANNPAFPPAAFPEYYEPSSPNTRPYQTVDYLVMFAGASVNWSLTVEGDGDPAPACGITLGEIEYADNPPAGWTAFNTTPAVIQSGSGSTSGWDQMEHNYRVGIDGGESNTASSSCTITYTITAL
jgi:hypothetical protein